MASIVSAVKRKLAYLTSFVTPKAKDPTPNDDTTELSRPAKRQRLNGAATPMLQDSALEESPNLIVESVENVKVSSQLVLSSKDDLNGSSDQPSILLQMLPSHVLSKCLAYIADRPNRFAIQTTCTLFNRLSNEDDMLVDIDLGGDWSNIEIHTHDEESQPNPVFGGILGALGVEQLAAIEAGNDDEVDLQERYAVTKSSGQSVKGGILTESDTSVSACGKLVKFSAAGNMQATYM